MTIMVMVISLVAAVRVVRDIKAKCDGGADEGRSSKAPSRAAFVLVALLPRNAVHSTEWE